MQLTCKNCRHVATLHLFSDLLRYCVLHPMSSPIGFLVATGYDFFFNHGCRFKTDVHLYGSIVPAFIVRHPHVWTGYHGIALQVRETGENLRPGPPSRACVFGVQAQPIVASLVGDVELVVKVTSLYRTRRICMRYLAIGRLIYNSGFLDGIEGTQYADL